jgi:hypothetical protein
LLNFLRTVEIYTASEQSPPGRVTARHETTHELLGLDADLDKSPENSYAVVRAIYTTDDFNTARRSHKTFV